MPDFNFSTEINAFVDQLDQLAELIDQRPLIEAITIDSEVSKDLDDAFWVEQIETGWIIDVAIADIAFFLEPEGSLFELVRERQVSEYRKEHVLNMFPPALSEGVFSLTEGSIKPVIWFTVELDHQLNLSNFEIRTARFSSLKRMTYTEVAAIVNNTNSNSPFFNMLSRASALSLQLLQKRRDKGALAFFDLTKGLMTDENGQIITIKEKQTTLSHIIVQELMILTNTAVASFFASNNIPFIFRNHTMRAATPPRDVLIDQYELALHDSSALNLLKKRIDLLANPACYETALNGHYGLNETAYTHVTSPIRRFADLICHYQIRSYLTGTPSFFSPETLDFMCSELNEGERSRRNRKSEHFLNKAKAERNDKANSLSFEALIGLEKKAFREILSVLKKMKILNPELERACLYKLSNKQLNAIELYYILLYLNTGNASPELFEAAKQALFNLTGSASQIMQYLKNDKHIDEFCEEEQLAQTGGFLSRITAVVQGGPLLSTTAYALAANKQKASHLAAVTWVMGFISGTLVDALETVLPDEAAELPIVSVAPKEYSAPVVNYYGKLLEMLRKQQHLSVGVDEYVRMVVDHVPRFKCVLPLFVNDNLLHFEGEGSNKKQAKHQAAGKVIEYLEAEKLLVPIDAALKNGEVYQQLLLDENYVSLLQLHVQQSLNSSIKYTYTESTVDLEQFYTCCLHLSLNGVLHQFNFLAKSKSEGRKQTSKMALEKLF